MENQWFYQVAGQAFGPVSFQQLRQLVEVGTVTETMPVRCGMGGDWGRADGIQGLPCLGSKRPLPIPQPRPTSGTDIGFDPYHVWLGIPPTNRPLNNYTLLGIAEFEDDPRVIANAADR